MLYIKNVVRFLTFVMAVLSMYSVGYVQAMDLHEAVQKGDIKTVKYLIENKADVNFQDETNDTPLHIAVGINRPSLEVVEYLIENKADINFQNKNKYTPLHVVVSGNNPSLKIIECLIKNKADLNVQNEYKNTSLHIAMSYKSASLEIIKYLIENKAGLNLQNAWGDTPLCEAVNCPNPSIESLKFLIENKADLNVTDKFGYTLLHAATNKQFTEVVRYLIHNKADINIKYRGMTFLEFLVEHCVEYIQSLNKSSVIDFRMKDCQGKTILDYAQGKNCYNGIRNLKRTWRTLEETQKVEDFLRILYVLRVKEKSSVFKVPRLVLAIIFEFLGIPMVGNSIKLFDC